MCACVHTRMSVWMVCVRVHGSLRAPQACVSSHNEYTCMHLCAICVCVCPCVCACIYVQLCICMYGSHACVCICVYVYVCSFSEGNISRLVWVWRCLRKEGTLGWF